MNAAGRPDAVARSLDRLSVWSHPDLPRIESTERRIVVMHSGVVIARSDRAVRALVMGHPPCYFLPPEHVNIEHLVLTRVSRTDPALGIERFFDVRVGRRRAVHAAWSVSKPADGCAALKGYIAFFAGRLDRCMVDGEAVVPEPGGVRGGWITGDVVGPFLRADRPAYTG